MTPPRTWNEFELIARLARRLGPAAGGDFVGIGDDCAAIPHAGGVQLVTCDAAFAGRHFLPGRTPMADVGWKIATANVSDVCACGGRPTYALVSLGLPRDQDPAALDALYDGLAEAAGAYGFAVLGGNVSGADALMVDVFMLGEAPRLVPRSGARPGDLLVVSGALGGAAAGGERFREAAQAGPLPDAVLGDPLVRRHLRPRARTELAALVQSVATAAIDISDGLSSELGHLAEASGVRLSVTGERVPVFGGVADHARAGGRDPLEIALHSGEEYELLFTVPPERQEALAGQPVTVIGTVSDIAEARPAGEPDAPGVLLDGRPLAPRGWDHGRD